jgi:hypothetical protein
MMKKQFSLLLIFLLSVVLIACDNLTTSFTTAGVSTTSTGTTTQLTTTMETTMTTTTTTTLTTTDTFTTTITTSETPIYDVLDLTSLPWVDENEVSVDLNNPNRGMSAYTLANQANPFSVIIPHKYDKNNGLTIDLSSYDLTEYRKLVVTAMGDGVMKLIINSRVEILNGKNIIAYPLTMIKDTFEFSFDFEGYDRVLESIESITIIFGADVNENTLPTHRFTSQINIETMMFTDEPANPRLTYNSQGYLFDPDEGHSSDPIELNQDWTIRDGGSYVITTTASGVQIATTSQKQAWSFISLILEGYYQQYTKIIIEVEGDAGAKFKMKLEGPGITTYETGSTTNGNIMDPVLNGSLQTFVWNLSSGNLPSGQAVSFLIFFEPGLVGTGKQMIIYSIRLE